MKETIIEHVILSHLLDYLRLKKIPYRKKGKMIYVDCPVCNDPDAHMLPNNKVDLECFKCKPKDKIGRYYNLIDIVKKAEPQLKTDEDILQHIKELLDVKVMTKKDEAKVINLLEKYKEWGFDLVPIVNNGKFPVEKDWTNKEHKDKKEWETWIKNGLNIGVKTGKRSRVTIIDIDQKPIPEEIDKIKGDCVIQESTKGYHLIYKYEPELPKTRIDELKIDIENDGGQVVIYPSVIDKVQRKFINVTKQISEMPIELKTFLTAQITVPRKTDSEKVREDIQTGDFNIGVLEEGQRNSTLVRLGGCFRKELPITQTRYVLNILNRILCERPLPSKEINAMMRKLEHYTYFDEQELAHKVLEYLRDSVEEAGRTEIAMAVVGTNRGEDKKRIDKSLAYLVKEGYILKKGTRYNIIKKAEWKESLIEVGKPIDFKMPYFYDVGSFRYGDLILIGSKNKKGKSHIAINIIKQLVKQGKKPYYISLETGSRFTQIALQLGLKEGDFKWDFVANPTRIELEPDAITILDWLCPTNFAEVDKLFMHFTEQLYKTNGVLIVFMQLKGSKSQDNEWFAPNMVSQFPALSARYIYDKDGDGEYGTFKIDVIREPKLHIKNYEIPCKYNWTSKELKRVDEMEEIDEKK